MSDDPLAYSHALRVTFAYDANGIALKHVRRVAMRVPAPATPPPGAGTRGHWLAVENAAGKVIFHVPLHNPLGYDHEVFPHDDAGGQPRRVAATKDHGTFEVLVPDLPGGARLVLRGPIHADGPRHGAEAHARLARSRAFALTSHSFADLRRAAATAKG